MNKNAVLNLALLLAAILVTLLMFEGILHLTSFGSLNDIVAFDEITGYRLAPGKKINYRTKDYAFKAEISPQGLRDELHVKDKTTLSKRILFLGDSQTFGHGVAAEDSYPKLTAGYSGYETINGGCVGWGPDQSLLFLKSYGMKYSPDVVIFGLYTGNDFQDLKGDIREKFIVNDTRTLIRLTGEVLSGKRQDSLMRIIKSYIRYHSRAASFLIDKAKGMVRQRGGMPWIMRLLYGKDDRYSKDVEPSYKKMYEILSDFNNLCNSRGISFYVLLIPHKVQVCDKEWADVLSKYGLSAGSFDRALPDKRIEEYCRANNIKFIDAYATFKERCNKGEELYFKHDEHLNKNAHRLLADLTASSIK